MKRQATGREKTFAKHMSDKGLQNTQRSLKTQQETKTADKIQVLEPILTSLFLHHTLWERDYFSPNA